MSAPALSVFLVLLVLVFAWQTVYGANRDLVQARAWGDVLRRILPLGVLIALILSLPFFRSGGPALWWLFVFALLLVVTSYLSVSPAERRANRAFRRGDYEDAARLFGDLAEKEPLARNRAFQGAALGAAGRFDESVQALAKAVEEDPEYGLAYYNRALILLKTKKKSLARKDLKRALEADMPRRFKRAAERELQEIGKV